jgi:acetyltransferase
MPVRNLQHIFNPQNIAVIGASDRSGSVGRIVFRNLLGGDGSAASTNKPPAFQGSAFPVNPKHSSLGGVRCFKSVAELPKLADLAVICTPAKTVPGLVQECGDAGILGLIILSAGFREADADGEHLELSIRNALSSYPGMRILGPNCLGIIVPHLNLNASFASDSPPPGNVAFISQSGALCTSILDWAIQENVGFSHFVSVGNMLDIGIADLIDYFSEDPHTRSIVMYVESINEAREFMSAARSFTRTKPIIAYKAGRFEESAQAAATHTGAMAGVDSVYEAAFSRAGIVRVFEVDDLFDCAGLLARNKLPRGARLAIVTNAGGPGVMASDALLERKGQLAELAATTIERLNKQLPVAWSHGNPVDVLGDATPERLASALEVVAEDSNVDGMLAILTPQAMTDPTGAAKAIVGVAKSTSKVLLAAWMGGGKVREGISLMNDAGIPTFSTPEKAVRAFMNLVTYARNREILYETPRAVPMEFPLDRAKLRAVFDTILSEGHDVLTESTSKALLEAYEIPVSKTYVARTIDDAVQYAHRVGFPVALKVFSSAITHKTDVGGVELNVSNEEQVRQAFERIMTRAKQYRPDAHIDGVTVQHMVVASNGHELIVGAKRDRVFGMVMLVGAGGTMAELFADRALELPPLSERLARRMLESLRSWSLLTGYRGRPSVNVERLVEVLMRLSYLVADYPEIVELDVNPLLVTPDEVIALDARILLDHQAILHPVRPYSHLAIRPYPDQFSKHAKLQDGTPVLLRPIKPEDEPLWHALVGGCSPETIHLRFRYMFKATTHEMATRFCFIDYDRELAIVAEVEDQNQRKLIGVARLVADVDHHEAEYAILVGDLWQGIGLGSLLTDFCLSICEQWGIRKVVAEVASQNDRMVGMFQRRGFELDRTTSSETVIVRRETKGQTATGNFKSIQHD